jgi:hypothetical protein
MLVHVKEREHIVVAEAENDYTNHAWYVIRRELLSHEMKRFVWVGPWYGSSSSFLYSH